jgi:integrase
MKIEETKRKLTSAFVKKDHSGLDKRYEIYDTDVSGFILRITRTGYKSYAFRYWYDGQSRQFTIEKADQISLKEARDIARDCRELVRQGKDPAMERRENREAKPKTLLQVIDEYKEKHFKKLKQSTKDDYVRRLNYFIDGYGKNRLKRPIKNFKRSELLEWLEGIAESTPTNAQRLQALLSSVFTFAIDRGYIENNVVKKISFKEYQEKAEPKQVNVAFDADEIQRLWQNFDQYNGLAGSMFKLLMILGQRSGETRLMKWNDIDFENKIWTIVRKDTKTKNSHEVPLPPMAINVLNELKRKTGDQKFVFNSSVKSNTPIVHPSKASQRIRKRSGVSEFNPHSLRTTFVTWQAELGTPKNITSKLVNHGKDTEGSSVTEIYDQYDYMPQKRKALNLWDKKLHSIITGEKAKVHNIA